jgi:hypothetical protein
MMAQYHKSMIIEHIVASLGFLNILLFLKASKIAGAVELSKRQWLGISSLIYIFQWQGDPNLLLEMPACISMDSQK